MNNKIMTIEAANLGLAALGTIAKGLPVRSGVKAGAGQIVPIDPKR